MRNFVILIRDNYFHTGKIIDRERFNKVSGEIVMMLAGTEYVNGFDYDAVTASYSLLTNKIKRA